MSHEDDRFLEAQGHEDNIEMHRATEVDGREMLAGSEDAQAETEEEEEEQEEEDEEEDIQEIPWQRLDFSRAQYRQKRLEEYINYTNLLENEPNYMQRIGQSCAQTSQVPPGAYYQFVANERNVQSTIVHFQLRNLLWATSRNSIYVVHEHCVKHWQLGVSDKPEVVVDLSEGLKGVLEQQPYGVPERVQISTLCVRDNIVAAGGFHSELVCKDLTTGTILYSGKVSRSDNGITNGIQLFDSPRLGHCVVTSNNDSLVRVFDIQTMTPKCRLALPWAVNYTALQPTSGTLAAVVGDDKVILLMDLCSGKVVSQLVGHEDYSFAAAWHPSGWLLATGNQDSTTILWDIRMPTNHLTRLQGRMSAIRSLRFSADGAFLAAAEPADFVHIYDVHGGFREYQEIDLFGEISGISFTPTADSLLVAISDPRDTILGCFDERVARTWAVFRTIRRSYLVPKDPFLHFWVTGATAPSVWPGVFAGFPLPWLSNAFLGPGHTAVSRQQLQAEGAGPSTLCSTSFPVAAPSVSLLPVV